MKLIITKDLAEKISEAYNDFMGSKSTFSNHVIEEIKNINDNKTANNKTLNRFIISVYNISNEF